MNIESLAEKLWRGYRDTIFADDAVKPNTEWMDLHHNERNAWFGAAREALHYSDVVDALMIDAAPDLLSALQNLVANQDTSWLHGGFTEEQIKAMPYLKAAREAIAKANLGAA